MEPSACSAAEPAVSSETAKILSCLEGQPILFYFIFLGSKPFQQLIAQKCARLGKHLKN